MCRQSATSAPSPPRSTRPLLLSQCQALIPGLAYPTPRSRTCSKSLRREKTLLHSVPVPTAYRSYPLAEPSTCLYTCCTPLYTCCTPRYTCCTCITTARATRAPSPCLCFIARGPADEEHRRRGVRQTRSTRRTSPTRAQHRNPCTPSSYKDIKHAFNATSCFKPAANAVEGRGRCHLPRRPSAPPSAKSAA